MAKEKRLKLIDYDEIRKLFDEQYKKTAQLIRDGETHLDNLAEGFTEADQVIWKLPTVDAVEVVRCKDCVWFSTTGYEEDNSHEEDATLHMGHCAEWRRGTQACRFCSYGERREGEDCFHEICAD